MNIGTRSLIAALLSLSAPLWAVPVVTSIGGTAYAVNSQVNPSSDTHTTSLSGTGSSTVSASVATESATLDYSSSVSGATTTLDYRFNENIGAPAANDITYYDYYYGYVTAHQGDSYGEALGSANFTLDAGDADYTYAINGTYLQQGTSATELYVTLYDLTANAQLLYSQQYDYPVATNANVVYGVSGTSNLTLDGSLTGALEAGHAYSFVFYSLTRHYEYGNGPYTNANNETPTSATGGMTLTLNGPVSAVPEPTTLALFGAGVAALSAMGLRRRK